MAFCIVLTAGYNLFPTTCFELNIRNMELTVNVDIESNYILLPKFRGERVAYKS